MTSRIDIRWFMNARGRYESAMKQHAYEVMEPGIIRVAPDDSGRMSYFYIQDGMMRGSVTGHLSEVGFVVQVSIVDPSFQGRGIGRRLYEAIARDHGYLVSDKTLFDPAIALWKRLERLYHDCVIQADGRWIMSFV